MSPRAAWRLESLGFRDVHEYRPGKVDWIAAGLPTARAAGGERRIGDIARRDVPTCRLGEPVSQVAERVRAAGWETCFVTTHNGIVLGRLDGPQLERGAAGPAERAMKPGPVTYRAHTPVADLAHVMAEHRIGTLPVTTSDGRLIGAARREDVERAHTAHRRSAAPENGVRDVAAPDELR